jgi:hypothetical protein
MNHATPSSSNTVEISCWLLSAIIAAILIYVICSELKKSRNGHDIGSAHTGMSSKKASSRRAITDTKKMKLQPLDQAFQSIQTREPEPAKPNDVLEATYASVFQNQQSEADEQFMKAKPKQDSAISGANTKAISKGLTETGRGADAPSRIVGLTANSWKAMMDCNKKPMKVGKSMVPFMDSSFRAELAES